MYDEYPEEAPEVTGQELMEIDGQWSSYLDICTELI